MSHGYSGIKAANGRQAREEERHDEGNLRLFETRIGTAPLPPSRLF